LVVDIKIYDYEKEIFCLGIDNRSSSGISNFRLLCRAWWLWPSAPLSPRWLLKNRKYKRALSNQGSFIVGRVNVE
jgi:hypothetical protein